MVSSVNFFFNLAKVTWQVNLLQYSSIVFRTVAAGVLELPVLGVLISFSN